MLVGERGMLDTETSEQLNSIKRYTIICGISLTNDHIGPLRPLRV